ncbi:MAG: hypothetical protein IMY74_03255 [Bacteroidetes bacterium]|nr:hypothetical protein [Bacteroidota bacterium]
MAQHVTHPLLGVDIVDAVVAAVGGGQVIAVACQGLKCRSVALRVPTPLRDGAAIGLWAPSSFHGYGQIMGGRLRERCIQNQEKPNAKTLCIVSVLKSEVW